MNTASAAPGKPTSRVEVTDVSQLGFWLQLDGERLFVAYSDFPFFGKATPKQLRRVTRPQRNHLRWPELDIDLAVDSIRHPDRFPLIARTDA